MQTLMQRLIVLSRMRWGI